MALQIGPAAEQYLREHKASSPEPISPAADFVDSRFSFMNGSRQAYTIQKDVTVEGKTTFGKVPLKITFTPFEEERTSHMIHNGSSIPMHISSLRKGFMHCLAFEGAGGERLDIVEHIASLIGTLRLRIDVVVEVLGEGSLGNRFARKLLGVPISWPSFPECNGGILDQIFSAGIETIPESERPMMTVSAPVTMSFPGGSMVAFEPLKEGQAPQKILRNGIFYPDIEAVGRQEFHYIVAADSYAKLARSRPPAFYNRRYCAIKKRRQQELPFFALNEDNVTLVGQQGIENPRESMIDSEGRNLEYFGHEVVDKLFPWTLLEESLGIDLMGTWSVYCASHAQEREFVEAFSQAAKPLLKVVEAPLPQPSTDLQSQPQ